MFVSGRTTLLLSALFTTAIATPLRSAAPATVVLVVRHAERAPGSGDVPLSEAGKTRARALAAVGTATGVQVIIHTQYQRTQQTAAPLAQALGLTPIVVGTQSDVAAHVRDVAAAARQHTGKTVLVVGHSNTVPHIVTALGGPKLSDLCDAEYDALFTVILDAEGGTRVIKATFGAATPVGPDCNAMR
jgi:broad specificity phosphatase PhoE